MKYKILLGTLLFALATVFGTVQAQDAAMPGEGVTLSPGLATWDSARPTDAIFRAMLEQLGYEVEASTSLANPIFYQSVTQGDVDYWSDGWFPLHNSQLPENFEGNAEIIGTVAAGGALQGYLVDKASAEEYGITSLEDFKRDEVKEAFDSNGDGMADMVACPPGWGCEIVINHHLDAYELRDAINPITAAYNASFADALARYNNGEPVLFYTWTPNFTTFELVPGEDVVWINVPEIIPNEAQQGLEDAMTISDVEGAVSNPLDMGFIANDIRVVANSAMLEENPAAASIFEQVQIPLEDITSMTARINAGESSDEDVAAMAQEWIGNHQEEVDGWLEEARAAAQ